MNIQPNATGAKPKLGGLSLNMSSVQKSGELTDKMRNQGVKYVHGTNLSALKGIGKEGALLCANDRDALSIKTSSGEMGYTQEADKDQPIRKGISLHHVQHHQEATDYSGLGDKSTPVLIGVHDSAPTFGQDVEGKIGHPVSNGSIDTSKISKVYIPSGSFNKVRDELLSSGGKYAPDLVAKLEEAPNLFK